MSYVRQKKQSRFYWAEIGFMLLGLLGLQPAIFSSFLSTSPSSSTSYNEPYQTNINYPTLESLKEWAAPHLASLISHAQSSGPIQTQNGWAPVPVSMSNVPSTSPNYVAAQSGQHSPPAMASHQPWTQSSPYASAAQQQAAYMAQLNQYGASNHPAYNPQHANQASQYAPYSNLNNNHLYNNTTYNNHPNQGAQYNVNPYSNQSYANPQYGHAQYNNPQYNNAQYNNAQYNNPQYGNPQYGNANSGMPYPNSPNGGVNYNVAPQYNNFQNGYPANNNPAYPSSYPSGNGGWNGTNPWNTAVPQSAATPWPNTFGYNGNYNGNNQVGYGNQWSSGYPYIASPTTTQQSYSAGSNGNWQRFQAPTNSYLVR